MTNALHGKRRVVPMRQIIKGNDHFLRSCAQVGGGRRRCCYKFLAFLVALKMGMGQDRSDRSYAKLHFSSCLSKFSKASSCPGGKRHAPFIGSVSQSDYYLTPPPLAQAEIKANPQDKADYAPPTVLAGKWRFSAKNDR